MLSSARDEAIMRLKKLKERKGDQPAADRGDTERLHQQLQVTVNCINSCVAIALMWSKKNNVYQKNDTLC